jgi:hypothetical protein
MTSFKQSKELMQRVRKMVLGHHEGEVIETTPVGWHVLMMYSRIRSLLEGACILLDARLPEEAIILGRQMFTDSLYLMEAARREPDRAALILGLANDTLTELENLERQALSLGLRDKSHVEGVLDRVRKRRKQIDGYRERHGIGRFERFRDEKQLAKDHGRLDEYLDFQFAHRMVHRADVAQAGRTRRRGKEVVGIYLRNPDDDFHAAVSTFIMSSAVYAHKAAASIFGWMETSAEEMDQVLAEIEQLFPAELCPPEESP